VLYYFILILVWATSPSLAYNFSELIEAHAVDTYSEFLESNEDLLRSLEAPPVAKEYYESYDLHIFDEFQTGVTFGSRRPLVNSLYDVFVNIRDDEGKRALISFILVVEC
jgi:ubiquinol oxidase